MTSKRPCGRVSDRSTILTAVNWTDWRRSSQDSPALRASGHEIFVDQLGRQPHQRALAENARARRFQHIGVDIGADDLDVMRVHLRPVLQQPDGDGIGLLAGRAGHRPDAESLRLAAWPHPLGQQIGRQAGELVIFAVEIGLVDGEGVDESLDLAVQIAAQAGEIAGEGRRCRSPPCAR